MTLAGTERGRDLRPSLADQGLVSVIRDIVVQPAGACRVAQARDLDRRAVPLTMPA